MTSNHEPRLDPERPPQAQARSDYRGRLVYRSEADGAVIEVLDRGATRALHFGTPARQSCMWLQHSQRLALPYTRAMAAFALLCSQPPRRILLLGLGGGSLAKFLLRAFPECQIEAVERSPEVVSVAHRFFDLPHTPRLRVHVAEARRFMATVGRDRYDAILVDTFDAAGAARCTVQLPFFRDCRRALQLTGVLAINLWRGTDTGCRETLALLTDAFDSRPLQLRVQARANLVALARVDAQSACDTPGFDVQAAVSAADPGLNLEPYAQQLERQRRWWGRWLTLGM